MLVESTTGDNNVVNFSPNLTKFGMWLDIAEIDKSHDFGCYGNHFGGNYEFLIYPNMVFIKWPSATSIQ